jgi:hypothetical protein
MCASEAQIKSMKRNVIAFLRRRGAAGSTSKRSVGRCGATVYRLVVCASFVQCLVSGRAADVILAGAPETQAAPAQGQAEPVQGRQMVRYKAFVRQAVLPLMSVTTNGLIEVGGVAKLDVTGLAQLSVPEKEALAGQFSVPLGVIDTLLESVASNPSPAADQVVQELRSAVIDYKFLDIEWGRFHPPPEGQQTKSDALAALQAGDLAKAWELYDGLARPGAPAISRPAPPTNLRVVLGP